MLETQLTIDRWPWMSNSRPLQPRSTIIALSLILSALRAASHATPSSAASIQGCGAHSTLLATALSGIGIELTVLSFGFLFFGVERMVCPLRAGNRGQHKIACVIN